MKVFAVSCLLALTAAAPAPEADAKADPNLIGTPLAYHAGPAPICVTEGVLLVTHVCTPTVENVCTKETVDTEEIEYEKICQEIVDTICDAPNAPIATGGYHGIGKRQAEVEADAEAENESQVEAEVEAAPKAATVAAPKAATVAAPEAAPEAAPDAEAAPEVAPEAAPEVAPEAEPKEAPEDVPEAVLETKAEVKAQYLAGNPYAAPSPIVAHATILPVAAHAYAHSIKSTVTHACREITTEHCVNNPKIIAVPIEVEHCHAVTKVTCADVENKLPMTTCDAVVTNHVSHAAHAVGYHGRK